MGQTGQRRATILKILTEQASVQVSELVKQLNVSAVTIRSDLTALEKQGLATRSHGGAMLARMPPTEQTVSQKDALHHDQKERIGALAATLVNPGENIIIDSGTTTLSLARHLREAHNVTVMTNGLNIARELRNAPGVDLIQTGGLLRKQSLSLQGLQAEACLQAYSFD